MKGKTTSWDGRFYLPCSVARMLEAAPGEEVLVTTYPGKVLVGNFGKAPTKLGKDWLTLEKARVDAKGNIRLRESTLERAFPARMVHYYNKYRVSRSGGGFSIT